jgi:alanine racemase
MGNKRKRITLRDVAKHAGVSPTAVSFAYNAPHQLSPATRERILETAAELGYQPHPVARTLATGRTNTIGFVVPTNLNWLLHDPLFSIVLGEMGAVCDEYKMRILLVPALEEVGPNTLATIAADGFFLFGIASDHPLAEAVAITNRPAVVLNGDENLGVPTFNLDDFGGGYQAAQHLLDRGHRRIAVATIRPRADLVRIPSYERRIAGYKQAVADRDLPPHTLTIAHTRGVLAAGDESFATIWSLDPKPTAVLAVSDVRALGIMSGARKAGLRIPEDLAVVGFDSLPESEFSSPSLTTVKYDLAGQVRQALSVLFDLINEKANESDFEGTPISSVQFIVREST